MISLCICVLLDISFYLLISAVLLDGLETNDFRNGSEKYPASHMDNLLTVLLSFVLCTYKKLTKQK